jgi:hypothetical protein
MGMFDYIKFEAPLPLNKKQAKKFDHIDWSNEVFQTKDLENILGNYYVNKTGIIKLEIIHGDHIDKPKPKGHNGFWFPYKFIETSREYKKINHTGDIYFYHVVTDKLGNEWWVEFNATFFKGKLKEIKTAKIEIHQTVEEIKEREDHIKSLFENDKKKFSTKFKSFMNKITFFYWGIFGRFVVSRSLSSIASFCHKLNTLSWRYF